METVVHLIAESTKERETALAVAENLLRDESGRIDTVTIVVQGPAIEAVESEADAAEDVRGLIEAGVRVVACENTMEHAQLSASDLVDGVETVPAGAVEVTQLQHDGFAYIRP